MRENKTNGQNALWLHLQGPRALVALFLEKLFVRYVTPLYMHAQLTLNVNYSYPAMIDGWVSSCIHFRFSLPIDPLYSKVFIVCFCVCLFCLSFFLCLSICLIRLFFFYIALTGGMFFFSLSLLICNSFLFSVILFCCLSIIMCGYLSATLSLCLLVITTIYHVVFYPSHWQSFFPSICLSHKHKQRTRIDTTRKFHSLMHQLQDLGFNLTRSSFTSPSASVVRSSTGISLREVRSSTKRGNPL